MTPGILSQSFYARPTLTVAKDLLGMWLVREVGGRRIEGRIVEVEAYVGPEDRASHASRGRTARTDVMFGPAGLAYIYLIYGMYHCFNVVTEREDYPAAVLVRAVELDGAAVGRRDRGGNRPRAALVDGPGRLCRTFQIDRSLNRADLTVGRGLWIEDRGDRFPRGRIGAHPRVGVDYAGEWAAKPWRFRVTGLDGR